MYTQYTQYTQIIITLRGEEQLNKWCNNKDIG